MHRAEVAEYACERVMELLGVEEFTGEQVVEIGIGNGMKRENSFETGSLY